MKDNMDDLLEKALQPSAEPSAELNASILNNAKQKRKKNIWYSVPKAAIAVLVFALLCPIGVYATNLFLKTVMVTDHALSVGNTEYYNEKDILDAMNSDEEVLSEKVSHEEGNDNVKWLTKDVEKFGGDLTCTFYRYDDYKALLADSKMPNLLSKDYELRGEALYTNTKDDASEDDSIDVWFNYGEGQFRLSITKMVKGYEENALHSLLLTNTSNKRTYKNTDGVEFTLVDEVREEGNVKNTETYVMIAYDEYYGHINFDGLTEDEIHEVLDSVKISEKQGMCYNGKQSTLKRGGVNMNQKKAGKVIGIFALIMVVVIVFVYIALYLPLKRYIDQTPKITPKSQVTVHVGDTVDWQDLFDVECKGQYTMKMSIETEYYNVVEVAEDGKSFIAKEQADEVAIYIVGRGENAESVDSSTIIQIEK